MSGVAGRPNLPTTGHAGVATYAPYTYVAYPNPQLTGPIKYAGNLFPQTIPAQMAPSSILPGVAYAAPPPGGHAGNMPKLVYNVGGYAPYPNAPQILYPAAAKPPPPPGTAFTSAAGTDGKLPKQAPRPSAPKTTAVVPGVAYAPPGTTVFGQLPTTTTNPASHLPKLVYTNVRGVPAYQNPQSTVQVQQTGTVLPAGGGAVNARTQFTPTSHANAPKLVTNAGCGVAAGPNPQATTSQTKHAGSVLPIPGVASKQTQPQGFLKGNRVPGLVNMQGQQSSRASNVTTVATNARVAVYQNPRVTTGQLKRAGNLLTKPGAWIKQTQPQGGVLKGNSVPGVPGGPVNMQGQQSARTSNAPALVTNTGGVAAYQNPKVTTGQVKRVGNVLPTSGTGSNVPKQAQQQGVSSGTGVAGAPVNILRQQSTPTSNVSTMVTNKVGYAPYPNPQPTTGQVKHAGSVLPKPGVGSNIPMQTQQQGVTKGNSVPGVTRVPVNIRGQQSNRARNVPTLVTSMGGVAAYPNPQVTAGRVQHAGNMLPKSQPHGVPKGNSVLPVTGGPVKIQGQQSSRASNAPKVVTNMGGVAAYPNPQITTGQVKHAGNVLPKPGAGINTPRQTQPQGAPKGNSVSGVTGLTVNIQGQQNVPTMVTSTEGVVTFPNPRVTGQIKHTGSVLPKPGAGSNIPVQTQQQGAPKVNSVPGVTGGGPVNIQGQQSTRTSNVPTMVTNAGGVAAYQNPQLTGQIKHAGNVLPKAGAGSNIPMRTQQQGAPKSSNVSGGTGVPVNTRTQQSSHTSNVYVPTGGYAAHPNPQVATGKVKHTGIVLPNTGIEREVPQSSWLNTVGTSSVVPLTSRTVANPLAPLIDNIALTSEKGTIGAGGVVVGESIASSKNGIDSTTHRTLPPSTSTSTKPSSTQTTLDSFLTCKPKPSIPPKTS